MIAATVPSDQPDLTSEQTEQLIPPGPRICILGAGFGGLYTALRLEQFPWDEAQKPNITLVDRHDRFTFLPLLYELVTGEMEAWEVAPTFEDLLAQSSIHFRQAQVSHIDLTQKQVSLSSAEQLPWDTLVLALGGETPLGDGPGLHDHALTFRSLDDAYRLKARLRTLEQSNQEVIRVAIVGAGYSGVELACKLADRLGDRGRVRLVERRDEILSTSAPFNREAALNALEDRGVWLDLETTVTEVGPDYLDLQYRDQVDRLPVDVVLWTIGNRMTDLVDHLDLPKTSRGQLKVNAQLQVENHPHIYALGDVAAGIDALGQPVPTTAQAAFQQADYAGWNIWASLTDRPPLPFRYQHLGEMMALGTDHATLSGLGLNLEGPLAHLARRLVYLQRMPTWEHQLKVGLNWIFRPFQLF